MHEEVSPANVKKKSHAHLHSGAENRMGCYGMSALPLRVPLGREANRLAAMMLYLSSLKLQLVDL